MVIKRKDVVEITPDQWETKKKTKDKRRKRLSKKDEEEEERTPLRGVFCLKNRNDMKIFEEKEDCFILDFDPNDSFDAKTDCPESEEDVAIIHEKGQVACRDFPHPRHLCLKFPFESSPHTSHCNQCYCYVCDLAAPCAHWTTSPTPHCEALENKKWKPLRELSRVRRVTTNNMKDKEHEPREAELVAEDVLAAPRGPMTRARTKLLNQAQEHQQID